MTDFRERLRVRGDDLRDRMRGLRNALSLEKIHAEVLLLVARLGDPAAHQLCDEMVIRDDEDNILDNRFGHEVLPFGSRNDAEKWLMEIYDRYSFEGLNRAGLSLLQRCRILFSEETDLFEKSFEMVEKRMFDGESYSNREYQAELCWLYLDVSDVREESFLNEQFALLSGDLDESGVFPNEVLQRKQSQMKDCARLMMLAYCRDMMHWLSGAITSNEYTYTQREEELDYDGIPAIIFNTTDCFAHFFRSFAFARKFQDFFRKEGEYDQKDFDELIAGALPRMLDRIYMEADPADFEAVRSFVLSELVPWILGEGDVPRDRFLKRNIVRMQGEGREEILEGL
jgi:hypothetical protein